MYHGYLEIDGIEVLNAARAEAYVRAHLPRIDVLCDSSALGTALGDPAYLSPANDAAPWVQAGRAASERFYGLFPGKIEGADDSTRSLEITELSGDGGVHSKPRHSSREIRVVATALAADEEALQEGLTWLRDILTGLNCEDQYAIGCTARTVTMFRSMPTTPAEAVERMRNFYRVEVLEGPLLKPKGFRSAAGREVEFILSAGSPWSFTVPTQIASLNMDAALNHQDPVGEDCSESDTAYDDFINDPYFTAIAQPPRPPVIAPPNILPLTSWRRLSQPIPTAVTNRWGMVVPIITLDTGTTEKQQIRIRFYESATGLTGCDYVGEFLVSYLPANSTMKIDGIRREVTVELANGRVVPGGHLLYGSDGRPFAWPTLGCRNEYTMVVDMMPDQPGLVALLDTAIRE